MSGSGDYISREAALNVVNGWRDQLIPTYGKNDEYVKCLETVAEHLESLLAADVRPVVLCRDCIFRSNEWTGCQKLNGTITYDEFFCKCGIKREEN